MRGASSFRRAGPLPRSPLMPNFFSKISVRLCEKAGWPACRDPGLMSCRDLGRPG